MIEQVGNGASDAANGHFAFGMELSQAVMAPFLGLGLGSLLGSPTG